MKLENLNQNYNKIADEFGQSRENLKWPELDYFFGFLKNQKIDQNKFYRILDIGCGSGRLLSYLKKNFKNFEYIGIDQSKKLLEIAKEKYPDGKFFLIDALDKKALKQLGQFDFVFSIASFHHLEENNHLAFLENIKFLLKENAYLFLTVWNLFNVKNKKNIFYFWKDRIFLNAESFFKKYNFEKKDLSSIWNVLTRWRNNPEKVLFYYAFRKYYLRNLLKKAKLKIVLLEYFPKNIFNSRNIILIAKK